jgi:hypothetical protein
MADASVVISRQLNRDMEYSMPPARHARSTAAPVQVSAGERDIVQPGAGQATNHSFGSERVRRGAPCRHHPPAVRTSWGVCGDSREIGTPVLAERRNDEEGLPRGGRRKAVECHLASFTAHVPKGPEHEGLLAPSTAVGLEVMAEMMQAQVTELACKGPAKIRVY